CDVQKRRQQIFIADLAWIDELRNRKEGDGRHLTWVRGRFRERQRGVGGAEVYSDDVFVWQGELLDLDFSGRDDVGGLARFERRQVDLFGAPAFVAKNTAGRLPAGRHVA